MLNLSYTLNDIKAFTIFRIRLKLKLKFYGLGRRDGPTNYQASKSIPIELRRRRTRQTFKGINANK